MKTILLCLLLVLCWTHKGQAQNKKALDSLYLAYSKAKADTSKIYVALKIAYEYRFSHADSTVIYGQKILTESKRIRFLQGEGEAWNVLGLGYLRKAQYQLAYDCYQKGLACFEKLNYERGMGVIYGNIGVLYERQANFPKALEYIQKSIEIKEKIGDKRALAGDLGNMGVIYEKQGNYSQALQYHQRCLALFKEVGSLDEIATCLGNIGVIYYYLNDMKQALAYYQKSLDGHKQTGNKIGVAYMLNNIGEVYYNQEKFPKAIDYLTQSVVAHEKINDRQGLIYPLNCLAISYQKQKDYDKSIEYAQKAYNIAKEIKVLNELKDAAKTLYESYKLKGEYDKALLYHESYKQTNDSIYNKDKAKAFAKLEAKAEIAQKEKEVVLSKKEAELRRIEAEREKTGRLASEKQAEAEHLRSLAKAEKDKHKQDSLYALSQKTQLEANVLKAQERTLKAEAQAKNADLSKEKQARVFQQTVNYFIVAVLVIVLFLAYQIYRSQQKEKRAKNEIETQKEEIETQAEQLDLSNKAKDRLFAIIAHDLRNPIMSFQGVARQIQSFLKKNKPERVGELVETIDAYSNNLNNLLDNLLNWALVQRNDIQIKPDNIMLRQEIDHCLQGFDAFAIANQLKIENNILPTVVVQIDKHILHTIVRNLISNAIKFTNEGGVITIDCEVGKNLPTKISVKDTGVGILPEKLAMLFQLQHDKSTQGLHGEKGIGIGLNLCFELAKMVQARLEVSSKVNEGSTFYLVLPQS